MRRKIVSILLILALIIGYMPISVVHAETKPVKIVITPNKTNAQEGDEILFSVSLQVNDTLNTIELDLKVPEGLTYVKESADFNQNFRTNVRAPETATEVSITEQNYSRYARNKTEANNLASNEIKILVADPEGICIKQDYETTGTVEIATFSATVNQGVSGTFTTLIDEGKSSFSKTGVGGNSVNLFISDVDVENNGVTVESATPQTIPVESVSIKGDATRTVDISASKELTLEVEVLPQNATNKEVNWTSSNEKVATVDKTGKVTIVAKGETAITATSKDNGQKYAVCNLTVACRHNGEKDVHEEVPATCKQEGHSAYTKCKVCGEIISGEDKTIPVADHNYGNLIPEDPGEHTANGLRNGTIAHYKCSECGKYFTRDKVEIAEKDLVIVVEHNYGDEWMSDADNHWHECTHIGCGIIKDKAPHSGGEATCSSLKTCETCGKTYGDLNANNHKNTEVRNAKDATCTEKGYTGDTYCKDCNTKISDGTEIKALGHTGGEATCTQKAVCTRCKQEYGELNSQNHKNTEIRNAKDATCTEKGYTGDTYCKDCNTKISEGTEIKALGHTGGEATCKNKAVCTRCKQEYGEVNPNNHKGETEIRNAKDATCTEVGYTGDTYCKDCNTKIADGKEIKALGHTGGEATCKDKAVCTRCQKEYGEKDPNNHKGETEIKDAKEAKCEEKGYTGDTYCKDCNAKIKDGEDIEALGHKGGEATCVSKAVCERCKKEYGELNPENHKHTHIIPKVEPTTRKTGTEEAVYCEDEQRIVSGGEEIPVREPQIVVKPEEGSNLDETTINAVKGLIAKIVKGESVKASGNIDEVKEIALDENKEFTVDLIVEKLEELNESEEKLIKEALKEKSEIAEYYTVKLILKVDGDEIAVLDEIDEEVKILLPIPTDLPEVAEGFVRTFYVVRIHNYDGNLKAELLPATVSGENAETNSNKFSTYTLAYVDAEKPVEVESEETTPIESAQTEPEVKAPETKEKSNGPKTGDDFNLGLWISVLVISGISLMVISKCKTKRKSKH